MGAAAAFFLHRRDAEVVIVERGSCGQGASYGNSGWITPGISSSPLAAPGVVPQALRWMIHSDSPFWIRPQANVGLLVWLFQFWRSSSARRYAGATETLVRFNAEVLELLDEYRTSGVEFEMHADGLMFPALSRDTTARDAELYETLRAAGYVGRFQALSGDEAREREPALGSSIAAALHSIDERHVEPESLTTGLTRFLASRGVEIIEDCPVLRLQRTPGKWILVTPEQEVAADVVVLAAGVWTADLLKSVGYPLRMMSGKGYSITFPANHPHLTTPAYLSEARVGITPFDGSIRLAGTFELTGKDLALRRRRLNALRRAAQTYLGEWPWAATDGAEWAGLRPVVSDGLPVIGPVPQQPGLYVATGHGMVGVTMSAPTGKALAEAIVERRVPAALLPLGFSRFR